MRDNYHYITETRIQVTTSQLFSWIFKRSSVSGLSIQISTSTKDHTEKESTYISLLQGGSLRDFVYEIDIKWSLERDKLTHKKSVHTHGHQL